MAFILRRLLFCVLLMCWASVSEDASAVSLSVTLNGDGTAGSTVDSPGSASISVDATTGSGVSYTVSGLTIDSVGTGDDSFSFDLGITPGNGSDAFSTSGAGYFGVDSSARQTDSSLQKISDAGESLIFTMTPGAITLGAGAFETGVASFVDLTEFGIQNLGSSEVYTFSVEGGAPSTGQTSATQTIAGQFFEVTYEGTTDGYRVQNIKADFDLVAVPEPASMLLGGTFFLIALMLRRL